MTPVGDTIIPGLSKEPSVCEMAETKATAVAEEDL